MRIISAQPEHDSAFAASLVALQQRAYAVEASLIGDDRIPLLQQNVAELCAARLKWLVAIDDARRITGAIAWDCSPEHTQIDRLVVEPSVHRRGTGRALLSAAVQSISQRPIVVSTGAKNRPARLLYESFGFVHCTDVEVLPGLWTARYAYCTSPCRLSNDSLPKAGHNSHDRRS